MLFAVKEHDGDCKDLLVSGHDNWSGSALIYLELSISYIDFVLNL